MQPLPPIEDLPVDAPARAVAKLRPCLRCRVTFQSNWAGERICPRCKGTVAWREGAPVRSHPSGGRR